MKHIKCHCCKCILDKNSDGFFIRGDVVAAYDFKLGKVVYYCDPCFDYIND